jgi:hypothetical protein
MNDSTKHSPEGLLPRLFARSGKESSPVFWSENVASLIFLTPKTPGNNSF